MMLLGFLDVRKCGTSVWHMIIGAVRFVLTSFVMASGDEEVGSANENMLCILAFRITVSISGYVLVNSVIFIGSVARLLMSKLDVPNPGSSAAREESSSCRRPVAMTFLPWALIRRASPAPMMRTVSLIDIFWAVKKMFRDGCNVRY